MLVFCLDWQYNSAMTKVEDLSGIHGTFEGKVKSHPDAKLRMRAVADGTLTYEREGEGEVAINVHNLRVRRVPGDIRRFVRAQRGSKGNRDKIIGLVDEG